MSDFSILSINNNRLFFSFENPILISSYFSSDSLGYEYVSITIHLIMPITRDSRVPCVIHDHEKNIPLGKYSRPHSVLPA